LLLHQQVQVDQNQWSGCKKGNKSFKNNCETLIYYLLLAVAFLNCLPMGEQHARAAVDQWHRRLGKPSTIFNLSSQSKPRLCSSSARSPQATNIWPRATEKEKWSPVRALSKHIETELNKKNFLMLPDLY